MTIEEYLRGKKPKRMTVEEYVGKSPTMTIEEFVNADYTQKVPKPDYRSLTPLDAGLNFLTQGVLGAVETAVPFARQGTYPPENVGESIGRGVGSLAGFVAGPLRLGSAVGRPLASTIGKGLATAAGESKVGFGAAGLIENTLRHAIPLSIAEGGSAFAREEDVGGAAARGALLGATFSAVQLINPKSAIVGHLARQLGGRALLSVTQQVDYEEALKEPNIAHTVWSELLNTWFFKNKISLEDVVSGNFRDVRQKQMVEEITRAVHEHNAKVASEFKRGSAFDIESMAKGQVRDIDLKDIAIDHSKLNDKAIEGYEKALSRRTKKKQLENVEVFWDEAQGKYVSDNNNLLAAYINLVFAVKAQDPSDTAPIKLNVRVATEPGGKPPRLATPARVALKFLTKDFGRNLSPELIKEADPGIYANRYVVVDVRMRGEEGIGKKHGPVRVMPSTGMGEISLKPHQVLVEVDANNVGRIVAGGSLMNKYLLVKSKFPRKPEPGPKYVVGEEVEYNLLQARSVGGKSPKLATRKLKGKILEVSEIPSGTGTMYMYKMSGRGFGLQALEQDILTPPKHAKAIDVERVPTAAERSRNLPLEKEIEKLQSILRGLEEQGGVVDPDVTKQLEQKQGELLARGRERIPEQSMLGSVEGRFETSTGMKFDATRVIKQAEQVVAELKKFPLQEAPNDYVRGVGEALKKLHVNMTPERFFKIIGEAGSDGQLTVGRMRTVDTMIDTLAKLELPSDRNRVLAEFVMRDRDIKKQFPARNMAQDLRKDQTQIEKNERESVRALWAKTEKEAAADPLGGSALQRLLTIDSLRGMLDFRIAALDIETKTGVPLYTIHKWLSRRRSEAYMEQKVFEDRLLPFVHTSQQEQALIREYYLLKRTEKDGWIDIYENRLSENGKALINTLDTIFKDMEPDIVRHRFIAWYNQNVVPRRQGLEKPEVTVFKNQKDPDVQALLKEGSVAWMMASVGKEPAEFERWLEVAREAGLGLIENGNYFPLETLGSQKGSLERSNLLWHIDAAGRGRFLSTGDIKGDNIDDMVESFASEKNLILSAKNYVRQVLNVKYLDEGLQALNDVADAFPEMRQARRKGFLRTQSESRAYTTEEYLKLYAMRLKGYPVKQSFLESLLKDTQLMFFRSLVVQPKLWVRNLAQGPVNHPSKKFMDPRFTKFDFNKLPEHVRQWFNERGVDDADAFSHTFLDLETSLRVNKVPILGKIWDFAGKFGKNYAKTDTMVRKFVYTTTWFRSKFYMDAYKSGQVDYATLREKLDLDKLQPRELWDIKEFLTKGDTDQGAFELAKWMTDNSQWKYSRYERGLDEMTGGGEALSNLLTWSKSMVQHTYLMAKRFNDGAKSYRYADDPLARKAASKQMLHASGDVAGIMIAGAVANGIYAGIAGGHMGKYSPYGADMFMWQFGGVTGQILTELTAKSTALVGSFDGTREEQKRAMDDWIRMVDKIGIRQMMPFMKQTLAVMESLTSRSFISPLYTLQSKFSSGYWRGLEKVDRTFLEGIQHAIFATDPNKSEDVRKYTWMKLQELQDKALMATGPMKTWYDFQVKRYEYYNDLFMRYQPVDVFREAFERESGYDFEGTWKAKSYSREKKEYRTRAE
jgi:hypothetical protein